MKNDYFEQDIARQIWELKYQFKSHEGEVYEDDVTGTWDRIATALSDVEAEPDDWYDDFYNVLKDFKFLPAGRITSGAGTGRRVTLSNCFTMGTIPDSLDGIFDALKEAALTMQQGGGIGYDFSTLRPKGAHVKGVDSDASGPLTFMDVWDAMCRTIMSAGSRRGAMMATMRCDHPDIEDFITAKRDKTRLRMFNVSVLVTDAFMEAVKAGDPWDLQFGGKVYRTVDARGLWDQIMMSTYAYAEPGVIFIDRVNEMHNISYLEKVATTNPCGEKPMGEYASCLLGSINLVKFVIDPFTENAKINIPALQHTVHVAIRMMDNVIEAGRYPLDKQRDKAMSDRQLGLGVTGLADMLIMLGEVYGSKKAQIIAEEVQKIINEEAYQTSCVLAQEKGPFPAYDEEEFLKSGFINEALSEHTIGMIKTYGIRNALLTSIAPTGTISMYANNVSSGIEPVFAMEYERKILNEDGTHRVEVVRDYAVHLYRQIHGPDVPLPSYFVTAQTLTPEDHVNMQAAVQKYVDSSISKTVNCPEDITFEHFKEIYLHAYETGCKGCTTYRPNDVTGSILTSLDEAPKVDEGAACFIERDPESGQLIRTCDA